MRVEGCKLCRLTGKKRVHGLGRCGELARARPVDDKDRLQRGPGTRGGVEPVREGGIGHCNARARILKIELQEIRRGHCVYQERYKAGPEGAKEGRRIGRGIVKEEKDAVAGSEPERPEPMAEAGGVGTQPAIGAPARRPEHRHAVGASGRQIVEQDGARILALGQREADLARTGCIAGYAVGYPRGRVHRIGESRHRQTPCHSTVALGCAASSRAMKRGDICRSRSLAIRPDRMM